tara:strand:- start:504 stop:767 length:264 start_codon:yes stop_codon:yes gene_type:complete
MNSSSFFSIGVFAKAQQNAEDFASNLLLAHTINECAFKLKRAEKEYEQALLKEDSLTAERKRLEIEACKLSLQFTANYLDNISEASK